MLNAVDLKMAELDIQKKYPGTTLKEQIKKLVEETKEVENATTPEEIVSEVLDSIQAGIGIICMLKGDVDIKKANVEHLQKLRSRGWVFEALLHIEREEL